jgi:hypothetical protein
MMGEEKGIFSLDIGNKSREISYTGDKSRQETGLAGSFNPIHGYRLTLQRVGKETEQRFRRSFFLTCFSFFFSTAL